MFYREPCTTLSFFYVYYWLVFLHLPNGSYQEYSDRKDRYDPNSFLQDVLPYPQENKGNHTLYHHPQPSECILVPLERGSSALCALLESGSEQSCCTRIDIPENVAGGQCAVLFAEQVLRYDLKLFETSPWAVVLRCTIHTQARNSLLRHYCNGLITRLLTGIWKKRSPSAT